MQVCFHHSVKEQGVVVVLHKCSLLVVESSMPMMDGRYTVRMFLLLMAWMK